MTEKSIEKLKNKKKLYRLKLSIYNTNELLFPFFEFIDFSFWLLPKSVVLNTAL